MLIHKIDVAKLQLDTAINLFLDDIDFISSLTLAGASEEISGKLLERAGKNSMLKKLHAWYEDTSGEEIKYGEFAQKANLARNCLKHSNVKDEDELEIYKWEAVQMIMRAMTNYKELAGVPTETMKKMAGWIETNKDIYATIE
jgi:hypothetical protein